MELEKRLEEASGTVVREGFGDFVCNGKELVGFVGVGGNGGILIVGFVMFCGGDGAKM